MKLSEWIAVDYRTTWYMGHRIRRLLADPNWHKLSGIVEADEMYVGGQKRPEDDDPGTGSGGSKRGAATVAQWFWSPQSAAVMSGSGGSRRIHRSRSPRGSAVRELIDPSARLITDGLPAYRRIGRSMAGHVTINHGQRRFSDGAGGHVNTAEGFIGLFCRSVHGTRHLVSRKHLDAYTTECTWRRNCRHVPAARKFVQAHGDLDAGSLGYRELVACG